MRSHPSRVRGLKFMKSIGERIKEARVAPFTGAWIEITTNPLLSSMWIVAPFTGAWIEMMLWLCSVCSIVSGK